jgi:hypothetical protein
VGRYKREANAEIARRGRNEETLAVDGIYSMHFRGAADWGMGILVLEGGKITGADSSGALYDGGYLVQGSEIEVRMIVTVPPGVTLVQGTPARPTSYQFPIDMRMPANFLETQEPVRMELPPGPINVIFRRLRSLSLQ